MSDRLKESKKLSHVILFEFSATLNTYTEKDDDLRKVHEGCGEGILDDIVLEGLKFGFGQG